MCSRVHASQERGVKADGPLDLPVGTVKMAVGASLTNYNFLVSRR